MSFFLVGALPDYTALGRWDSFVSALQALREKPLEGRASSLRGEFEGVTHNVYTPTGYVSGREDKGQYRTLGKTSCRPHDEPSNAPPNPKKRR